MFSVILQREAAYSVCFCNAIGLILVGRDLLPPHLMFLPYAKLCFAYFHFHKIVPRFVSSNMRKGITANQLTFFTHKSHIHAFRIYTISKHKCLCITSLN